MLLEAFLAAAQSIPVLVEAYDRKRTPVFWNRTAELVSGYSAKELVGNPRALEIMYPEAKYRRRMYADFKKRGDNFDPMVWVMTCKGGEERAISWFNISRHLVVPGWHSWAVGLDITEKLQIEEELKRQQKELERQLRKTAEAKVALRILLEQREVENKRMGGELIYNFNRLVKPFLDKLSRTRLDRGQATLLELALENLKTLDRVVGGSLATLQDTLTQMELEVAMLVARGQSTSEIAETLNLAEGTVSTHRHHIRRKLGLLGSGSSLTTALRRRLSSGGRPGQRFGAG